MIRKTGITALMFFAAAISCTKDKGDSNGTHDFPREKTLYVAGFQWGEPNSFNPLIDQPAWPIGEYFNLVYEPLMLYSALDGSMKPLIARSYANYGDRISVVLDPRARWSDGTPLTAADVKFTYDMGVRYPEAPTAFMRNYVDSVFIDTMRDSAGIWEQVHIVVGKKRNNPLVLVDYLQLIRIVPKRYFEHLIDSLGGFSGFQRAKLDRNPVVSGPYTIFSYSNEKIILKRRDDYWGYAALYRNKKPKPEYIIHPIYKSNDHISLELQKGDIDVSQSFIPRIWLKKSHQVYTWYATEPYFIPASISMFLINVTKFPLVDKAFRRAMACAINYGDINKLAISGYSPPLQPGLILPFGSEKQYFSEEDTRQHGAVFDTDRAKKILAGAGYSSVFDREGNLLEMRDPGGNRVPTMYITSPVGWTDWETAVRVAVKDLRSAGIDIREGFIDAGLYYQKMLTGDFDLLLYTPSHYATPSKPWSRFEETLTARNWKPVGEKVYENWGRFNRPDVKGYIAGIDSLLAVIPSMTDENMVKAAYRKLNVLFMDEQPAIPLFYRPEWFYEYSTRNWKGFPNQADPYTTPQCLCCGPGRDALWRITPVK